MRSESLVELRKREPHPKQIQRPIAKSHSVLSMRPSCQKQKNESVNQYLSTQDMSNVVRVSQTSQHKLDTFRPLSKERPITSNMRYKNEQFNLHKSQNFDPVIAYTNIVTSNYTNSQLQSTIQKIEETNQISDFARYRMIPRFKAKKILM